MHSGRTKDELNKRSSSLRLPAEVHRPGPPRRGFRILGLMDSKFTLAIIASGLLLLAKSATAQLQIATPSPTPPTVVVPHLPAPTPTPPTPPANANDYIPVIITYGDGTQTQVQITRGMMQPVGIPPREAVTVTLFLTNAIPGSPVKVGLYDGGQIAAAVPVSSPAPIGAAPLDNATPTLAVAADQSVRFNFQSAGPLGLYRALLTIGPKQYLLQFFAVRPRPVTGGLPSPTPTTTPIDPGIITITAPPTPSPTGIPIAPVVPSPAPIRTPPAPQPSTTPNG
jgi:hypothetical protein